jgi:putative ABC transport system substrate-binding protein
MRRRNFISLVGGAAAWPLAAGAQPERMRRIAALINLPEDHPETKPRLAAFREGLEKLGWSEGRNIRIDYRFAPAANLEAARVEGAYCLAARRDIRAIYSGHCRIPTRDPHNSDCIHLRDRSDRIGFRPSLARPGGNITGFMQLEWGVAGKWLQMLKEIAPHVTRAAFIFNPRTTSFAHYVNETAALARSLAIELVPNTVETSDDIERTIESFAKVPNSGLVVPPDATTVVNRNLIVALAARHRLPAVYAYRHFVAAGGLMSYGIDTIDPFRQATSYLDRILRGAEPANLPVQAPTKYETVLNLKTAKALGLTVPPGLLVAADEVIE